VAGGRLVVNDKDREAVARIEQGVKYGDPDGMWTPKCVKELLAIIERLMEENKRKRAVIDDMVKRETHVHTSLKAQLARMREAGDPFRMAIQLFDDSNVRFTNSASILVQDQSDEKPMGTTLFWGNLRRLAEAMEEGDV
jgi:hypothetical protein